MSSISLQHHHKSYHTQDYLKVLYATPGLRAVSYRLGMWMAAHCAERGCFADKTSTLAETLGVSERSIQNAKHELISVGFLRVLKKEELHKEKRHLQKVLVMRAPNMKPTTKVSKKPKVEKKSAEKKTVEKKPVEKKSNTTISQVQAHYGENWVGLLEEVEKHMVRTKIADKLTPVGLVKVIADTVTLDKVHDALVGFCEADDDTFARANNIVAVIRGRKVHDWVQSAEAAEKSAKRAAEQATLVSAKHIEHVSQAYVDTYGSLPAGCTAKDVHNRAYSMEGSSITDVIVALRSGFDAVDALKDEHGDSPNYRQFTYEHHTDQTGRMSSWHGYVEDIAWKHLNQRKAA